MVTVLFGLSFFLWKFEVQISARMMKTEGGRNQAKTKGILKIETSWYPHNTSAPTALP